MRIACSRSASAEPLAGTGPTETHLLLVEAPGSWGRTALADCSLPEPQRRALAALPEHWRVILVRRPDRPLRRQTDRFVWLSAPAGPALRWRLPVDASVLPDDLPSGSEPVTEPTLFVCTNGGRDRCCALYGRALFDRALFDRAPFDAAPSDVAASPATWECSHLGGHRFAPTALRLPDRLVFGRLDDPTARAALAGGTPLDTVRGPAGWQEAVQAAAVAVWRTHGTVPLESSEVCADEVQLRLADGTHWSVPMATVAVAERLLSCGTDPVPGVSLHAGPPVQVQQSGTAARRPH